MSATKADIRGPSYVGAAGTISLAKKRYFSAALLVFWLFWPLVGKTETPEEWITLGARVHGAFGSFIPLGIKIGLDAVNRLNAKPRELTVLYYDGTASHARTDEVRMQLCIGTSIAIIVPTTIRSYLAHREKGLVVPGVIRVAQSGHHAAEFQCPLLGVERTLTPSCLRRTWRGG